MRSLLLILGLVLEVVVSGAVLATLWGWFLIPFGLPAIKTLHAAGVIACLHATRAANVKSIEEDDAEKIIFYNLLHSVILLVLGFFIRLFM